MREQMQHPAHSIHPGHITDGHRLSRSKHMEELINGRHLQIFLEGRN